MSFAWTAIGTGARTEVRVHVPLEMSSLATSPPLLLATNSDFRSWLSDIRYGFLPQPEMSLVGWLSAPAAGGSIRLMSMILLSSGLRTTSMLYLRTLPRQPLLT